MNSILVDTNVLIYAIDEDSVYFEQARDIISRSDLNLYTTSKNLSELMIFFSIFTILSPTEKSYRVLIDLLKHYQPIGLQIHDFEIASIGLAYGIDRIATMNEKDFKKIAEIELYGL